MAAAEARKTRTATMYAHQEDGQAELRREGGAGSFNIQWTRLPSIFPCLLRKFASNGRGRGHGRRARAEAEAACPIHTQVEY